MHLVNNVLLEGMKTVGERLGKGETQLPFVLESAETMKAAIGCLEPHMGQKSAKTKGRILLATVKGDVHDIGKNLVGIILSNNGFDVEDIGIKQPIEEILKAYDAKPADAIGLSGLLVKSTVIMKESLAYMSQRGYRVPVILGGAALTKDFVETACREEYQDGAVFYAADAFDGLKHMENVLSGALAAPAQAANMPSADDKQREEKTEWPTAELTPEGQSSWVTRQQTPPEPPFWGLKDMAPPIGEVMALLSDGAVMQNRWAFTKGTLTNDQFKAILAEKAEPLLAHWKERVISENLLEPRARYGYFPVQAQGSSLNVFSPDRTEIIATFAFPRQPSGRRLAISDFYNTASSGFDVLPIQMVTLGSRIQSKTAELHRENKYSDYFYLHGLAAEYTECCAKWLHRRIKAELSIKGGQRYSFGYPPCPNLEGNGLILNLLNGKELGVAMTESLQLEPEFTTCALVAWHPQAVYFTI
jgi:5-methyltetrahydrofolate--homocysteine methyltransferase